MPLIVRGNIMLRTVSALLLLLCSALLSVSTLGATGDSILSMKERAETIDRLLAVRLETLPAHLMRREGIDMWILVARGI